MTISNIRDAILQRTSATEATSLRNGQIVQGEILKIYPNNKAEIQIGGNKMIAEITTPLSVGRKYYFQVQATEQLIQLKVIGDHLKQGNNQNIMNLMNQLGVKVTRANTQFVHMLMNDKVPFNSEQLQQALQILDNSSNKNEAMSVLKEMLANRLPITNNVFQALSSNQSSTISPLLNQLVTELSQLPQLNEAQHRLLNVLENLVVRPLPTELHVANQVVSNRANSEPILNLLKIVGLVDQNMNQSNWNNRLEQILQTDNRNNSLEHVWNNLISRENSKKDNTQTGQNNLSNAIKQTFNQLTSEASVIQSTARKIMSIFHPLQTSTLSNEQFSSLRSMVVDQLLPHLPESTKEVLLPLLHQNNSENRAQIMQVLQTLGNDKTYELSQNIVKLATDDAPFLNQSVQKQFLSHVSQYMQSIGISEEHGLKTQLAQVMEQTNIIPDIRQADSVKSLLVQMIQQDGNVSGERVQQMIHFINGMQLQSVQESNNFMHAALQIPGDKLGLNDDIFMQFEGKKDENGQINPDHCRILFVLNLQNLRETIIDMHVQKRIISVTVFNDSADLTHNMTGLKNMLDDNLGKLNYHLSAVKWKPLHEQNLEEQMNITMEPKTNEQKERFDFLI